MLEIRVLMFIYKRITVRWGADLGSPGKAKSFSGPTARPFVPATVGSQASVPRPGFASPVDELSAHYYYASIDLFGLRFSEVSLI